MIEGHVWIYQSSPSFSVVGTKLHEIMIEGHVWIYQSSPSFSLAGTSMTLGLSMILAVLFPFSTIPTIHDWYPSCFSMSLQYAAACSLGKQIRSPPDVSAE